MNTVLRPASEGYAKSSGEERLSEIAEFFREHGVRAEVLTESEPDSRGGHIGVIDEEKILGVLRIRPCRLFEIAKIAEASELEVMKVLSRLIEEKKIVAEQTKKGVFYRVPPSG